MEIDYQARLDALLEQSGADMVGFVPGENMVYFTGLHFHLSERPILGLYNRQGLSFIIPELEVTKLDARPDLEARRFMWSDHRGYHGAFAAAVSALADGGASCALDGETLRYFEWLALEKAGLRASDTRDVGQLFLNMRARKAPQEIAKMQRAIDISEAALAATMAWARPGMTEREIADRLSAEMLARGAQGVAFLLVLTGEKSGLPHGNTGDRIWGEGEFLLIDFGALYEDYPADITRTFCAGEPTPEMRAMFEAVLGANRAARQFAKPGVSCEAVDRAAREVIEAAGLGEYFIHRLGHGLGLSVHELPNIVAGNQQAIEPGMVFTIEPGVYIPGIGGIRIEDNVVVTEAGIDALTSYPRGLNMASPQRTTAQ
ncbi:MAG: aminopeptidase P family protein [Chloroflexi bacterium]|nr:aminopeptidase P family protein [Chloroflexota bacterium]MCY3581122.1 aminopeptidase P family protein [Chloroflexota bacterium]MCY3715601.1 aminopeptidase P family protein [Chloroflexota bacterium]MDE2650661.1 aminopeptidase P family protein [Chloroflexota bacterium]MXX52210.1 aminopeptidase P family protein [Chloroflexota bacterium]